MRIVKCLMPVLLCIGFISNASAGLMWQFGFSDSVDGFSGTGSFSLSGPDSSAGATLDSFLYEGTCGGFVCEFGLPDVTSPSWLLSGDQLLFVSLDILAQQTIFLESDAVFSTIHLTAGSLESTSNDSSDANGDGVTTSRRIAQFGPLSSAYLRPADTSLVPTPATLALFGLGLAGLGWSRRKKV